MKTSSQLPPSNLNTAHQGSGLESEITWLSQGFHGQLLRPQDSDYETARRVWNGMIDRRPAVITRCAGEEDVCRAVSFARRLGMVVAVKGGGHNVAGNATCEGGLMIDLSLMRGVKVDPERRVATVEGGCLLSDLDRAAQAWGLATPAGIVSTTGVGGLTLGGGFGWLSRKFGLTIDSLLSARLVTANGERINAGPGENEDLFWAIRGGGGNFGIATAFEFRLHPVGPQVFCGMIIRPFEQAQDYLRFHRAFVRTLPDELTVWMVIRQAPPLPFLPADVHGKLIVALPFVYLGDPAEGEPLIEPLRRFGASHGEHFGLNQFADWQTVFDGLTAPGARNYWKSHYLTDLDDAAITAILDYAQRLPSPQCEIFVPHMEGAVRNVSALETAYPHRGAPFVLNIHARWESTEESEACMAWARGLFDATRASSTGGVYVNFLSDEGEARVRAAYPGGVFERLARIKCQCDPDNFFRLNQNIRPSILPHEAAAAGAPV
jgi:FAD/FMN-containing dehydrogenase